MAINSSAAVSAAWTGGFPARNAVSTFAECPSGFGFATRKDSFRADGGVRSVGFKAAAGSRRPGRPVLPIRRFTCRRTASYPPAR